MWPGSDQYLKVPLPYGFNAFYAIGRAGTELARGKPFGPVFGNLATTIIDSFNPIGGAGSIENIIAPTVIDPIVDLGRNRDFADRPIMPEQSQFGPETPDNQRYWGSIAPHWKAVTDFLTSASGGDEVVPGAVDVSPETLEYLFGVVTGAAGTFFDRTAGLIGKAAQIVDGDPDVEIERNDLPLVRKVIGTKPGWYDKAAFYARLEQVDTVVAQAKDYIARGDNDGLQRLIGDRRDVLTVEAGAKEARSVMRKVKKERTALELGKERGTVDDATYKAGIRTLDDREKQVLTAFNRHYLATVETPVGP
jgi:hypothetical protein